MSSLGHHNLILANTMAKTPDAPMRIYPAAVMSPRHGGESLTLKTSRWNNRICRGQGPPTYRHPRGTGKTSLAEVPSSSEANHARHYEVLRSPRTPERGNYARDGEGSAPKPGYGDETYRKSRIAGRTDVQGDSLSTSQTPSMRRPFSAPGTRCCAFRTAHASR